MTAIICSSLARLAMVFIRAVFTLALNARLLLDENTGVIHEVQAIVDDFYHSKDEYNDDAVDAPDQRIKWKSLQEKKNVIS